MFITEKNFNARTINAELNKGSNLYAYFQTIDSTYRIQKARTCKGEHQVKLLGSGTWARIGTGDNITSR